MDMYEELAMMHLTRNGKANVFVCPQYDIDGRWASPDFVALDFESKTVWVVEVSGAASLAKLLKKVRDRERQWFEKLRQALRPRLSMTPGAFKSCFISGVMPRSDLLKHLAT